MGTKRKKTPLAVALLAVDQLSDDEMKTVLDYIRGKQPRAPRKKKAEKGPSRLPSEPDILKDSKAS